MKTTKKPMMAKRATKAAPAKKKMMTSAKKPMTVAGKKVQKYQVGGPAMNIPKGGATTMATSPAAMNLGRKPASPVQQPKVPPKQPGMSQGFPKGRPGMPGMPGMPGQGMISNNPGGMGMLSPEQIARNNMARQQLMQQGMTPGQIQAQEAAIRQEMLRRGMPLGQGMGLPVQRPGSPGAGMAPPPSLGAVQGGAMAQDALAQQLMAQRPQKLPVTRPQQKPGMAQSGFLNQMYPGFQPDPNYQYNPQTSGRSDPQAIAARLAEENNRISAATQQRPGFRKGGAVKKKAPANGRMAKPKGRTAPRGRK